MKRNDKWGCKRGSAIGVPAEGSQSDNSHSQLVDHREMRLSCANYQRHHKGRCSGFTIATLSRERDSKASKRARPVIDNVAILCIGYSAHIRGRILRALIYQCLHY